MTTFSTKISFVPRDSGVKSVSFDLVDYGLVLSGIITNIKENLQDKFEHLNFRVINNHYYDFVSVLEWEEFLEFHKKYQTDGFSNDDINSFMKKYNDKVIYNWVVIEIYEWESGLD